MSKSCPLVCCDLTVFIAMHASEYSPESMWHICTGSNALQTLITAKSDVMNKLSRFIVAGRSCVKKEVQNLVFLFDVMQSEDGVFPNLIKKASLKWSIVGL